MKTSRFIAGLSAALIATSMTAAIPASAGGAGTGSAASTTTVAKYDLIDVVNALKDAGIDNENVKNVRNFLILNVEFFDGNDYETIIKAIDEVRILYTEPTSKRIFGKKGEDMRKLSESDRYHIYDNLQPAGRDAIKKKFEKVAEKLNVKTEWSTQTVKSDTSSTDYGLWYGTLDVSKAVRKGDIQKTPSTDLIYKGTDGTTTKISKAKIELAGTKLTLKYSNGKLVRRAPKAKVTYNGKVLTKGKDYTLTYKNIDKMGKATIVVNGKGNFSGKKTVYFYIVPGKASFNTFTTGGDIVVNIAKDTSVTSDKTNTCWNNGGYQIQFCTNKSFKNNSVLPYALRTFSTTSFAKGQREIAFSGSFFDTFKDSKGNKTVYVRVRPFIKVDGKRYYGAWSDVIKAI